jgi:hypothetical protein
MAGSAANTQSLKFLAYAGGLGAMLFTLPTVLLMLVGMAPTLVAYMTDRRTEKYTTFCVGSMNFGGVLPYVLGLWIEDNSYDGAFRIMSDPIAWLIMLSAAGFGWIINLIAPNVVAVYLAMRLEQRIHSLGKRQRQLVEQWGPRVAGEGARSEDYDDD